MCGIVGYVGEKSAVGIIVEGLKKLEYRGYDSAGIAILQDGALQVRRAAGKMKNLETILRERPVTGSLGIGHTRWATHGRPSEENAHPHTDCGGALVVVHNGILENYLELKERLQADGHVFKSETDTEVLAHLFERHLKATESLDEAVRRGLLEVRGAYAVVVVSAAAPDRLIAAKQGAGSVVVGLGKDEMFIASDIPAILAHTRDVVILEDGDMAIVTAQSVAVSTLAGDAVPREPTRILWDPIMAEKGGYRHFMLKEMYEQPRAIADTFRGRVAPEKLKVREDSQRFSESVPAGRIIEQHPGVDAKLKEGASIAVVVSKGPEPRVVPDFTGKTQQQVTDMLKGTGLEPKFTSTPSENVDATVVLDWDHKGESVAPGTTINVTVSSGAQQRVITDWRGKPFDATLQKAMANGGSLALPKMPVPGIGWLAYAKDTEGNLIALTQRVPAVTRSN